MHGTRQLKQGPKEIMSKFGVSCTFFSVCGMVGFGLRLTLYVEREGANSDISL